MSKKCFVISPIGKQDSAVRKEADNVLKYIIRPAMEECGIATIRGDEVDKSGRITEHIFQEIYNCELCIADLSNNNPNVFYELAIAQTANRPVILLLKKDLELPFDVKDFRCVFYDLEISSYEEKIHIKRIVNYVKDFESRNWKMPDPFAKYRTLHDIYFEPITERRMLYERASEMIRSARKVLDTTWGKTPKKLSPPEELARNAYRQAIETAIMNGAEYNDLFTNTEERLKEMQEAAEQFREFPNYEARCIHIMDKDLPVADFLVTDNEEVLLSHVSFKGTVSAPKYLYVKSKSFADFYSALFGECWNHGKPSQSFK